MSRHTFALFFLSFFLSIPIQLSRPCRHPSIRTLCERYSLGARWVFSFSRCCYLVIDLSSRLFGVGVGPQDLVAVTWTRRSSSAVRIKTLYATARIALLLLRNGSYTSPLTFCPALFACFLCLLAVHSHILRCIRADLTAVFTVTTVWQIARFHYLVFGISEVQQNGISSATLTIGTLRLTAIRFAHSGWPF